jgi:hypothetical protein
VLFHKIAGQWSKIAAENMCFRAEIPSESFRSEGGSVGRAVIITQHLRQHLVVLLDERESLQRFATKSAPCAAALPPGVLACAFLRKIL